MEIGHVVRRPQAVDGRLRLGPGVLAEPGQQHDLGPVGVEHRELAGRRRQAAVALLGPVEGEQGVGQVPLAAFGEPEVVGRHGPQHEQVLVVGDLLGPGQVASGGGGVAAVAVEDAPVEVDDGHAGPVAGGDEEGQRLVVALAVPGRGGRCAARTAPVRNRTTPAADVGRHRLGPGQLLAGAGDGAQLQERDGEVGPGPRLGIGEVVADGEVDGGVELGHRLVGAVELVQRQPPHPVGQAGGLGVDGGRRQERAGDVEGEAGVAVALGRQLQHVGGRSRCLEGHGRRSYGGALRR